VYVVAVVGEKGGVGKTTICLDLAVTATRKGHKVAVLDVDQQATASKWTDRRTEEHPWVVPTHAARIAASIEQAKRQGVDFIVIDTPPHSSTDAAEAARRADVVVAPIEPHLFALETLGKLADLLKIVGDVPCFVVINKAPVQGSDGTIAAGHIREQGFTVAPGIIHLRAAHRHAGNLGKVAAEYDPNGKAAEETLRLYSYTVKLIDTQRSATNAKAKPAHARS
jgi:chromosome partitioning protein